MDILVWTDPAAKNEFLALINAVRGESHLIFFPEEQKHPRFQAILAANKLADDDIAKLRIPEIRF